MITAKARFHHLNECFIKNNVLFVLLYPGIGSSLNESVMSCMTYICKYIHRQNELYTAINRLTYKHSFISGVNCRAILPSSDTGHGLSN